MEKVQITDWHKEFRGLKKDLGLTNADIAAIIGNSADSVRVVTLPSKSIPRWLKFAIYIHKKNSEN
jgi:hypothetical protein